MTEKEDIEEEKGERCWLGESKKKEGSVCLIPERCKGCGFCIEFCPVDALDFSEDTTEKGYNPPEMTGECILCETCEKMCPEFAIYVKKKEEDDKDTEKKEEDDERGEWI